MGEKETAAPPTEVMFNPKEYTVTRAAGEGSGAGGAQEGVQWEPHKAPADVAEPEDEAALKTRHDTVKNSIGNVR